MNTQEKVQKVIELEKQIKDIEAEARLLKNELTEEMKTIGTKKYEFDFGKVTIVQTERLQIVDEKKVIAKVEELGLANEYVAPRLTDFFNLKEFVATQGMTEGIISSVSEYLKITPNDKTLE